MIANPDQVSARIVIFASFTDSTGTIFRAIAYRILHIATGCLVVVTFLAAGCTKDRNHRTKVPDSRPSEWAYLQRTFPHGQFSASAYEDAYRIVDQMRKTPKSARIDAAWELAGPTNVGGRITDVEFDPINPDVVYTSAATGGVFKSTDKGETWTSIFDGYATVNIGDIGIPKSNSEILYVGTGEANGGANNLQGAGVFKSDDAGITWRNIGLERTASIGRIIVHPANPDLVYVAAMGSYFDVGPDRGVYRSADGGENWEKVLFVSDTTGAIDLVMNPKNPDILYAAMWHRWRHPTVAELSGRTSGVYKSTDGGDTWSELGPETGLPDPKVTDVARIGLAIHEADPDILYAVYTGRVGGAQVYTGLYKTTDAGASWIDFDATDAVDNQFQGGFSWFFGQVRVSPVDPDRVYVMEVEFQHTRDGGQSWGVNIGGNNLHVDHHALAFHPDDPEYVISGNDGGLNISEDGGNSWRKIIGLPITQFYEIEIDSRDPRQLYGGTQDNRTVMTPTGAVDDWIPLELPVVGAGGDGFYVKVVYEPLGFKTVYTESQQGALFKSIDGDEFRSISPSVGDRRNWNTPYVFPPDSSSTLYYGTHSLYKSPTRGTTWFRVSPKLAEDYPTNGIFGTISTIDIAPAMHEAIIVGTDDGNVWITADDGLNWSNISAGLPERWVTRVKFDPVDPMVAYVTFSGLKWNDPVPHVFRTDDFGQSWIDVSGNLPDAPVNAFAVDPIDPDIIFVGTDVGAFVHFNRGDPSSDWEILGDGLPAVAVYDMKVNADPHFVVVGTHGRSMFKLNLESLTPTFISESRTPGDVPTGIRVHGSYPNPFSSTTTIRFESDAAIDSRVEVFDLSGRLVARILDGATSTGVTEVDWDGRSERGEPLSSGTYLYRISTRDGRFSQTGRVTLIR